LKENGISKDFFPKIVPKNLHVILLKWDYKLIKQIKGNINGIVLILKPSSQVNPVMKRKKNLDILVIHGSMVI